MKKNILKHLIIGLSLSSSYASAALKPPGQWWKTYKNIDWSVSDDFWSLNFNKWTWVRPDGGLWKDWEIRHNPWKYININNGRLIVKGLASTKRGGGIGHMKETKYGFYITKWRQFGIDGGHKPGESHIWADSRNPNTWIPAIWATGTNNGFEGNKRSANIVNAQFLEVDLVELYGSSGVASSHTLTWFKNQPSDMYATRTFLQRGLLRRAPGGWQTYGFEYAPNYVKFWRHYNGSWKEVKRIPITNNANSWTNINRNNATGIYWQIKNGWQTNNAPTRDCSLEVDYFYYYPRK